ncbi:hypothetical protein C5167_025553 [Papaver somniferum]|uniref:Plastid lipid-associated protein/fibrillin conserved domain-containing protein n=1 Tax=Papaver somniferum TaxID=3469 RepID=A0A4Y7JUT5_PAPSO|nr:hypothetical protein C5167_025553 [Papaver somniferum]
MAVISSCHPPNLQNASICTRKGKLNHFPATTSHRFLWQKAAVNTPFPICCLNNFSSSSSNTTQTAAEEALLAKNDLLDLIADEDRGVKTQENPLKRMQIIKAIEALRVFGKNSTTSAASLSDTWRMLWTTEKEQLFIIENAYLFGGTQAGDILQVIDVGAGVLNNVITFPPSGVFILVEFTSAVLRGENWEFPLPPFGRGWFDSVYIDDNIRVAKDIRGDYLVVDRAPYRWKE